MSSFWTCGPFKDAADRAASMAYKAEQMKVFMEVLEDLENNQEILENGSPDEKIIASLAQIEIDKKIATLLGVPYDASEEKNDEVLREVLFEYVGKRTKE